MQPTVFLSTLLPLLLFSLGCTGLPVHGSDTASMADRGLEAAVAQVNSAYAASYLYRPTRGSVTKVIQMGSDTVDLLLSFAIKETQCAKGSAGNLQDCAFRPGFFVPTHQCSSRVRMSQTLARLISLSCGHDGSSSESSESSEEKFPRHVSPFGSRDAAPSAPPAQPGSSFRSGPREVQPRGDAFSNYLV
ncbi:secreted phosphoprotein 24 [Nelusetta ayraudi]|uniref:secreted phosphoprotein 24 n=1 Tax=Nelusetta ayraudi TaxID=303726 RepID=UPI003F70B267